MWTSLSFPMPFTGADMLPHSSSKRGQLRVEISPSEQTASAGGGGDDVGVLEERVKGLSKFFWAVMSGREVEAQDPR